MEFATILLIALGLSVDSFLVAIGCGLAKQKLKFQEALIIGGSLAFFQGALPIIGFLIGSYTESYVETVDHWIAFIIFALIGFNMIKSGLLEETVEPCFNPLNPRVLLSLSVATSIDALIVGISLAFFETSIWNISLLIAAVTYLAVMIGILFGKKAGLKFGKKMELFGGGLLILIGIKILVEHLFF